MKLDKFLLGNKFSLANKKEYFEGLVKTLREASLQSKIREKNLHSKTINNISNTTPTRN